MKIIANEHSANDIFKFIRQNTGLTQKEFGNIFDLKENTIHCYECSRLNFNFELILRIVNKFNIKIYIERKNNNHSKLILNNYKPNEILKIIRKYTELTQEEFGNKLNLARRTIQNYELGFRKYNFELLLLIAKEFDLEIIIKNKEK